MINTELQVSNNFRLKHETVHYTEMKTEDRLSSQ